MISAAIGVSSPIEPIGSLPVKLIGSKSLSKSSKEYPKAF